MKPISVSFSGVIGIALSLAFALLALTPQPALGATCPTLTRDLSRGMSGPDVTQLQLFLISQEYLASENATGYFGPLTQTAVKQFQKDNGVPQTGYVGPLTRAAIAAFCNVVPPPPPIPQPPPVQISTFSVNPSTGSAPLAVQFRYTDSTPGRTYTIHYGDSSSDSMVYVQPGCSSDNPQCAYYAQSHTYADSGNFVAVLKTTVCGGSGCAAQVVASISVGVAGAPAQPFLSATPASGTAPLAVHFTGRVHSAGYSIDFGDGTTSGDIGCAHGGCPGGVASSSVNVSHTYAAAGTYTAKLRRHFNSNEANCAGADCNVVARATVTVSVPVDTCRAPTRDLRLGDTDAEKGGDVSVLQRFLKRDTTVYPEGLVTGFFGRATETATRRFQVTKGITPTGFVGPLTRAAIRVVCGLSSATSTTPYKFSATPVSGAAPLSVAFSATSVETQATDISYAVNFGDGSRGDMTQDTSSTLKASHTYTSGGTFTAKLLQVENLCGGSTSYGCVRELQVDSLAITVTGDSGGGGGGGGGGGQATVTNFNPSTKWPCPGCVGTPRLTYVSPGSGAAPLIVVAGGSTRYINLGSAGPTPYGPLAMWITWGDGETTDIDASLFSGRDLNQVVYKTHIYAAPGKYTVTLEEAYSAGPVGKATITVSGTVPGNQGNPDPHSPGGGGNCTDGSSCKYN